MNFQPLILASTSIYRRELLSRLQIPFETAQPSVDETPRAGEPPRETALRLSIEKARAVRSQYPDALIIGSDQVAWLDGQPLGKPLTHDRARAQLQSMRGKRVVFYTALTLLNAKTGGVQSEVAENRVYFRELGDDEIESYLNREKPYHCAGSAKSEGLGISLIGKMEGDDPNALVGLPLILLVDMLKREGRAVL